VGWEVTELSAPLTEFLVQAIPQEAGSVHKSYKLVPAEDIGQEMWAAVLMRRDTFERLADQGAWGVIRRRLKEGGWKLVKEDDRYRRAVKAASAGYSKHDEQFYTIGILKKLIPMWLDNGVTERPPQGREQGKVSGGGSGSDFMAMMLDIDEAMAKVRGYHRSILKRYYSYPQGSGGWTHLQIAGALGIGPDALRQRVYRALRAVQRQLGGRNPWNRRALEYEASASTAA
jgi:hypothetical protein